MDYWRLAGGAAFISAVVCITIGVCALGHITGVEHGARRMCEDLGYNDMEWVAHETAMCSGD